MDQVVLDLAEKREEKRGRDMQRRRDLLQELSAIERRWGLPLTKPSTHK